MEIKQWQVNVYRLLMCVGFITLMNFALTGLLKDVPADKHLDKILFAGAVYYAVQEAWDYLKKFFNGIKPSDWDKDPYA